MSFKPVIKSQSGGQLLIGGLEAHYDTAVVPRLVITLVEGAVTREKPFSVFLWEIEANERMPYNVKETRAC